MPKSSVMIRFNQLMSLVHAKEAGPPTKVEFDDCLKENVHILINNDKSSFSVLEW